MALVEAIHNIIYNMILTAFPHIDIAKLHVMCPKQIFNVIFTFRVGSKYTFWDQIHFFSRFQYRYNDRTISTLASITVAVFGGWHL